MLQAIARLIGWTPPAAVAAPVETSPAVLAAAPPPGLAIVRGAAGLGMPAPLFDPALLRARNRARALAIAQRNPR